MLSSPRFRVLLSLRRALVLAALTLTIAACVRPVREESTIREPALGNKSLSTAVSAPATPWPTPTLVPTVDLVPTADPTRPQDRAQIGTHTVRAGETLTAIASFYGSTVVELVELNQLEDSDQLVVNQVLLVPSRQTLPGSAFKIIPNSELVYGPALIDFDTVKTVAQFGGYLSEYSEEVEQRELSGAEVVELIARRFSIGPRLLLAVVEHQSGWVTAHPTEPSPYPLGFVREGTEGLYWQLHLAANLLNLGFYGRAEGGLTVLQVGSDSEVAIAPGLNDGSAGVQLLAGGLTNTSYEQWQTAVGSQGFYATYQRLFGNPFAYTVDPLLPSDLNQPELTLPWAVGETWYYTSGPHGAWASGSAWAALDFAPPGDVLGCYRSDHWVLTMSAGTVVYSDFGAVVVDIDGDGFAGTGWAITYMHLESRDRVPEGQTVTAGHRLGHPSCEGGFSNGTHVHVARSYNGRWISADGGLPFVMDGWTTQGLGREYDGLLIRDDLVREACSCREANNAVTRLPDG